ncbi:MAG TPA: beta-eliminating lyase-related protein [Solirubrobacterales bacterium]|nr:beta-eliminating lyase-related protein [Solirubrobacterales bacterium]
MSRARGFASDNSSGAHPDIFAALAAVNEGHVTAYGGDPETARLEESARREFGPDSSIFPMMNGTGANIAALRAMARPHQAVICAETAHLSIDETAAPEAIAGLKLLTVPTPDGKLTPELAATRLADPADIPHVAWPAVISIAQVTEMGTVYTPQEVGALADFAHEHDLLLHMDGSRLANAAAFLEIGLAEASTDNGVDVLSLGANKNGAMFGEAVVFREPGLTAGFEVLRKGTLQLASKMRFVSAQLGALLENELWRDLAGNANRMAVTIADAIPWIEGAELAQESQGNLVFIALELEKARTFCQRLSPHRPLLFPIGEGGPEPVGMVRLVASWDTEIDDVDHLLTELRGVLA